nr:glycosyltransferase [Pseudactinotalea terrae]
MQPWVLYVGPFSYPWGQAGSRRVHGIAKSIVGAGYNVVVGASDYSSPEPAPLSSEPRIHHFGTGELPTDLPRLTLATRLVLTGGRRVRRWLDRHRHHPPAAIIVYGGFAPWLWNLHGWARRHGVALIADIVEWYDPRYLKGGRFGPLSIEAAIAHHVLHRHLDGVISISSYLRRHHDTFEIPSVMVPPTIDFALMSQGPEVDTLPTGDHTEILYFGTPGAKDELETIVRAAANVKGVRLVVAGPSFDEVQRMVPVAQESKLLILGNVPQDQVRELVKRVSFTILIRKPKRSNQAGFPTKFVESMSVGTPVIANHTSDLANYLDDGINGLVSSGHSVEAVTATLQRAARLNADQLASMGRAAKETGHRFSSSNYTDALQRFLEMATTRARNGHSRANGSS